MANVKAVKELLYCMTEFFAESVREERILDKQEEDFFQWWEKIEADKDQYNLRMAFDAGYKAGKENA